MYEDLGQVFQAFCPAWSKGKMGNLIWLQGRPQTSCYLVGAPFLPMAYTTQGYK